MARVAELLGGEGTAWVVREVESKVCMWGSWGGGGRGGGLWHDVGGKGSRVCLYVMDGWMDGWMDGCVHTTTDADTPSLFSFLAFSHNDHHHGHTTTADRDPQAPRALHHLDAPAGGQQPLRPLLLPDHEARAGKEMMDRE